MLLLCHWWTHWWLWAEALGSRGASALCSPGSPSHTVHTAQVEGPLSLHITLNQSVMGFFLLSLYPLQGFKVRFPEKFNLRGNCTGALRSSHSPHQPHCPTCTNLPEDSPGLSLGPWWPLGLPWKWPFCRTTHVPETETREAVTRAQMGGSMSCYSWWQRGQSCSSLFFFFLDFLKLRLIYHVVPISAVQQSDPGIHIHIQSFSHIIFHHVLSQEIRYSSLLYSRISLLIHSKYNSLFCIY